MCAQDLEGLSTGVTEHQVESTEPIARQVLHGFSGRDARQRNRRVEVIEAPYPDIAVEQEPRRGAGVRTIGGHDRGIGRSEGAAGFRPHRVPIVVQH